MSKATFLFSFAFIFLIISQTSAEMRSWIDKNGVRHFTNVNGPHGNENSEIMEEYKPDPTKSIDRHIRTTRQRPDIMTQYQENVRKEKEKMDKILEKEKQQHDKELMNRKKMLDKMAKDRQRSCAKKTKELEKLRRLGWKNFKSQKALMISCPDRKWVQNGRVFDNMSECIAKRNRYWQADYEQAIKSKEYEYNMFCSQ